MTHEPGWDAKAIARIAMQTFGGTRQMFEAHGWAECCSKMRAVQQKHVKNHSGSVEAFVHQREASK